MCKLIAILLFALTVVPSASWAGLSKETVQGGIAGIRPVSSEEFFGKINTVISEIYKAASPIIDSVAVIMIAVAGVTASFMLFSGASLLARVLGSVFSIAIGLLLYYNAPHIVGLVKGLIH